MGIDNDVKLAVETVAKAKIAEAMGGDVIAKIVTEVMEQKSDKYGRHDAKTWFEQVVFDSIESVVRQEIAARVEQDDVKEMIKSAVAEKAGEIALTVASSFASQDWRAELKININRD